LKNILDINHCLLVKHVLTAKKDSDIKELNSLWSHIENIDRILRHEIQDKSENSVILTIQQLLWNEIDFLSRFLILDLGGILDLILGSGLGAR